MFPPQTSFIPIHIALARYLEIVGWRAIFESYPYWYLGSTPFRWLTGPVMPLVLVILHKFFFFLNLFEIFWLVLAFVWPLGGVGVYLLVRELRGERWLAFLAAFFYFFGPIIPFLFRFSDGLYLISFSLLPWCLASYISVINPIQPNQSNRTRTASIIPIFDRIVFVFLATFIFLTNTIIIPQLILGLVAVFLATTDWKATEEKLKRTFYLLLTAFLIATFWYGPRFWWQILISPSFAGRPFYAVANEFVKLLPQTLAIVLALAGGKVVKSKNILVKFIFYWLFIFGFLTLLRFLSDPDYWLDWLGYGIEIQFGLAIGLSLLISSKLKIQSLKLNSKLKALNFTLIFLPCALYLVLFIFIFNHFILANLQPNITQAIEYKIGSKLSEITQPADRVFLSGTTAFWLNAFFDTVQLRGGRDPAAKLEDWDKVVWEVREGREVSKSYNALKKLGINYLVVHTDKSWEYYHDFVNPEKFEQSSGFVKVYDEEGDRIYKIE